MDPERDQSGDYGYDLAHDDAVDRRPHDEPASPERARPAPARPQDLSSDYGYDEAHGF